MATCSASMGVIKMRGRVAVSTATGTAPRAAPAVICHQAVPSHFCCHDYNSTAPRVTGK